MDKQAYYEAKKTILGYKGRVYTHDSTGNHEQTIWLSEKVYDSENQAIDAACDWADQNGVDVELG